MISITEDHEKERPEQNDNGDDAYDHDLVSNMYVSTMPMQSCRILLKNLILLFFCIVYCLPNRPPQKVDELRLE